MSMETHREYIGYLYEWDGTEMLTDEEIVRCRDCKYASYDSRWCYRLLNAEEPPTTPDGFCAWGERRDA